MTIVSTSPCRVSLFGGGTDVGEYAEKYGGMCINFAINIRQEFLISDQELLPQRDDPFVKKILKSMGGENLYFSQRFNGEINGGLGSSAAASVALVGAVNHYKKLGMTKAGIAERAWEIEVNELSLFGGKQDQYCSVIGGISVMQFTDKFDFVPLKTTFLYDILPGLVLFHSGFNRTNPKIQEGFKKITPSQKICLDAIKKITVEAIQPLGEGNFAKVGKLMDQSWSLKQNSNEGVADDRFNLIYKKAKELGAYGGKLLGAGGGGYCLFVIDPSKRQSLVENLGLKEIDFSVDYNGLETRIL